MRPLAFVVSGIGFVVFFPFGAMMVAFAHDAPNVSQVEEVFRGALVITLLAIPIVWVGSLATYLIVARRKIVLDDSKGADLVQEVIARKTHQTRKDRVLKICALSPYYAFALHLSLWIIPFVLSG